MTVISVESIVVEFYYCFPNVNYLVASYGSYDSSHTSRSAHQNVNCRDKEKNR